MENRNPVPLFSTAYFGPLDYYCRLKAISEACVEAYEHYCRQTFRNRCIIAGPNGRQSLTVPVATAGKPKWLIKDVKIAYGEKWQINHIRSIETAYANAAYFLYYRDEFFDLLQKKHTFLLDMNMELLQWTLSVLKIKTRLDLTASFIPPRGEARDYRYLFSKGQRPVVNTSVYYQVFADRHGFFGNLSILDLIFNEGPSAAGYLKPAD